jgi:Enolase, N-terminal domain
VKKLRCQDGYAVDCQRMMAVGLAITARQCRRPTVPAEQISTRLANCAAECDAGGPYVGVQFSSMSAIEIFDSRGRRTLAVSVTLAGGRRVRSCVPFGASIGSRRAVALYGHDDKRCAGISVRRAESPVRVGGPLTKYRKRQAGSIGRR